MRLLIITQKVDKADPVLGFFHKWIEEFAKNLEEVIVICLERGSADLPKNVQVFSLGKEDKKSHLTYILRFYKYIWQERKNYDAVFVHMNPEYLVLGGWLWRLWHKKIALWYVHRQVNVKLRLAAWLSDVIFTSAPESFGLKSKKVQYVGHGIDVSKFELTHPASYQPLVITHVGRITQIKNLEVIIEALKILRDSGVVLELKLVGEPQNGSDEVYKKNMVLLVAKLSLADKVTWVGTQENVRAYTDSSLTINAAPDGGMDKSVLESLASGRAVFASNKAFKEVFEEQSGFFLYPFRDSKRLAQMIKTFLGTEHKEAIVEILAERVKTRYGVTSLVKTLVERIND